MRITLIGDSHGDFKALNRLLLVNRHEFKPEFKDSVKIHIGDLGIIRTPRGDYGANSANELPIDFFIRGNHDEPELCHLDPKYLGDFGYDDVMSLFYFSGAHTPEQFRHHNPWYPEEEISYFECQEAIDLYTRTKPRIMIAHDAPYGIPQLMGIEPLSGSIDRNRTNCALEAMFAAHKPEVFFYGHWHYNVVQEIEGTTFVAIGINSAANLEI